MRLRTRFVVVLAVLLIGTSTVGVLALIGVTKQHHASEALPEAVSEMELSRATHAQLLRLSGNLEAHALASTRRVMDELEAGIELGIVRAGEGLAELQALYRERPAEARLIRTEQSAFRKLVALWQSGLLERTDERSGRQGFERVRRIAAPMETAAKELAQRTVAAAIATEESNHASFTRSRNVLAAVLAITVALGIAFAFWLTRTVVPRTLRYSHFAQRVAEGDLGERIDVRGSDELAELGETLNEMVSRRERERAYAEAQDEFADALQVASSEEEAHTMIQLHLERSIADGAVAVLNRNNSADRLELKTPVGEGSPLPEAVSDAEPRSCLAVRYGRAHREGDGRRPLLSCQVCGGVPGTKTCNPLLVGGEVIGSVLVTRERPLDSPEDACLTESIVQAAPVLANLRNLAIAELRAATDSLTGLPNNRSVRDTIKRMCAEAGRTASPLSAALLDLDHFKQINDTFGHGRGDDVLASVGAVLRETVRESDFVGRLGGEEFLLLLPATDREGALVACEKVREAISRITVPGVERSITASLGIAVIPEHAGDPDELLRAADRAVYAAKEAGRDRVEVAKASEASQLRAAALAPERKDQ